MTGDPGIITVELPDLSQLAEQPRSIGGIKGNISSTETMIFLPIMSSNQIIFQTFHLKIIRFLFPILT